VKVEASAAQSYNELLKAKGSKSTDKLGEEFEAFFITNMLKEMDKATHVTKKGFMRETYTAIMYEKLGEYLAKKGLGVKDMMKKYMERAGDPKVFGETGDNRDK
jgi:Rod binding domain-containing protein